MARQFQGVVVSAKVPQTLVVEIRSKYRHPLYNKVVNKTKKLKVHHDLSAVKEGDVVEIRSCRPISKTKHHIAVAVIAKE